MNKVNTTKKYNTLITEADDYLEDLDYNKAIAKYLDAIKVDPKQTTPYIKIADIDIILEDYQGALDILDQAKEAIGNDNEEINNKYEEVEHLMNLLVEGIITDGDGNLLDEVVIAIKPDNEEKASTTTSTKDGKFSVTLEKGSYTFMINLDGYDSYEESIKIEDDIDNLEITLESSTNKIYAAFADSLQSYLNQGYKYFSFIYYDNDSIPELAVSNGDYHGAQVTVLQYNNGSLTTLISDVGEYGQLGYIEKQGLFVASWSNQGYSTCRIMRNNDEVLYSDSDNMGAAINKSDYKLYVNDVQYSDTESFYNAKVATGYWKHWIENGYDRVQLADSYYASEKMTGYNVLNSTNIQLVRDGNYKNFMD